MNIRAFSLSLILAFVLLAAFAALNWVALATTSTLNFGFAELTAPLGVIMLVFTAAISGLFIIYIVLLQAGVILEERRLTKALKAQSELADTAETSRYTELRSLLEVELRKIEAQRDFTGNEFNTRMEASEQSMLKNLAEATASLSANLGEIEDKLDRVLATGASGMVPLAAR